MHVYTYTPIGIHTHSEKLNTIHSTSVQCSIIRYKYLHVIYLKISIHLVNKRCYYFQNTGMVHEYVLNHVIYCNHFD